jgi:hypothetical protein
MGTVVETGHTDIILGVSATTWPTHVNCRLVIVVLTMVMAVIITVPTVVCR